ncbi:hypothetical protein [Vibrio methylphosphonaticus]|uniref:hypothetical protein n=1 Tax=Vibrio methylphosphonaticus TaxID=2946866 RepID=UPI00202A3B97|nr:hypothetical protein [Vibrio methylphosphonaticus]MCL9777186.1 hypothetical protein [Vibrio methylphosphonaticus]
MIRLELAKVVDAEMLKAISISAFAKDYKQYGSYPPGIESLLWHQTEIEKGHYYKIQYNDELAGGICVIPSENNEVEVKYFLYLTTFKIKE